MRGGLGTVIAESTSALAAAGVAIDLYLPARAGYRRPPPQVQLHELAAGTDGDWPRFCADVVTAIGAATSRADVIHCHDWMTGLAGVYAREALRMPFVFSVHLPHAKSPECELERHGAACADVRVVNSSAARLELLARHHACAPARVIPHGVDLHRYRPTAVHRTQAPDAKPGRTQVLLFVGRLCEQKGVDVLIRAFAALRAACTRPRLVIVGDGEDALYLRRLVDRLGVADAVEFGGWRSGSALVRAYQSADVVVVPSRYEPFGMVALEAMACARPVVASLTGGLSEIIEHGVSGLLVAPDDHLELARVLFALLRDPPRQRSLATAARHRAADYPWTSSVRQIREAYAAAIARHGRLAHASR